MTVYWPNGSLTRPYVTSDYDAARKNPVTGVVQPHNGIDLVGWTDNCSPVDGTVVFAGYNGGAGNEVRIRADGPTAFHVGDYYRILHHASLYVRTGDRVKARQPVGRMGTTGQSTGVHCHFETHEWRLWNPVNPTDYMNRANAGESTAGGDSTPFDPKGFLMALNDDEQRELLAGIRGLLSSENQVKLFQNVQTIRDRVEGNLSSENQVKLFQNVQTIRDRVDVSSLPLAALDELGRLVDDERVRRLAQ